MNNTGLYKLKDNIFLYVLALHSFAVFHFQVFSEPILYQKAAIIHLLLFRAPETLPPKKENY